jgi:hypothetical protein
MVKLDSTCSVHREPGSFLPLKGEPLTPAKARHEGKLEISLPCLTFTKIQSQHLSFIFANQDHHFPLRTSTNILTVSSKICIYYHDPSEKHLVHMENMEPSTPGIAPGTSPSPAPGTNSASTRKPQSNEELKEWCIVYAREWALGNTLTTDPNAGILSNFAVMDPGLENFDKDFTRSLAMDMPTALAVATDDLKRGKCSDAAIRWLCAPNQSRVKVNVEKLMNEELQGYGDRELKDWTLIAKVRYQFYSWGPI